MDKKTYVIIIVAIVAVILIAAAGIYLLSKSEDTPTEIDTQKYLDKSIEYIDELRSGQITSLYENSSELIKNTYSYNELYAVLSGPYVLAGSFVEYTERSAQVQDENIITVTIAKNTRYTMTYTITYDVKSDKVVGIFHNPVPTEVETQSSEKWEELSLKVGTEIYPLNAMLTLPKDVQNAPLVIFVHGSGPSDMNETIGASENAVFEDLAHGLAEQGIASLRYDKRTFAHYGVTGATIQEEVLEDISVIIKQMSQYNGIDSNAIYIAGHSLGGMMAPIIAEENPEVKGIVSLAGTLRGLEDIVYDQNILALSSMEIDELQKRNLIAQLELEVQAIKNISEDDTKMYLGVPASYWYSLNSYDRIEIAQNLQIPMLILQGEDDFQVYADKDYALWQESLKDKSNVSYQLYEGLNHLFMESESQKDVIDTSVYDKPANVDQRVINDIANWIKGLN